MSQQPLDALVDSYIAAWNATVAEERAALVACTWTPRASYVNPMMAGDGHAGIDAMIAGCQARFPGFRFTRRGALDAHGEHLRFSWDLAPEGGKPVAGGTDYVVIEDGRMRAVTGFLDFSPGH